MVLKYFILHEKYFKTNSLFPHYDPPPSPSLTHPTTHPLDYRVRDNKRGEGGLIKVKKQVDFKIHFR